MAACYWLVPVRSDHALRDVGFNLHHTAQSTAYPFELVSILIVRSRSYGYKALARNWRRERRWLAAARSDSGVTGDTGSEKGRGMAHRDRSDVGKLDVLVVDEGALACAGDCSPEFTKASGALY